MVQKYTLAVVPVYFEVADTASDSLRLIFGNDDNPTYTEFAIVEDGGLALQEDGTLGQGVVWRTYQAWGGSAGQLVSGLTEDTEYVFSVRARNGDGVETGTIELPVATTLAEEEPEEPEEPEPPVVVQPPAVIPTAPKTGLASDLAKVLGLQPLNLLRLFLVIALVVGVSVGVSKIITKRKMERV